MSTLDNMEKMLAQGRDSALLRYGLGNEYLKVGQPEAAARHLQEAVRQNPDYSAAWKLLGKALAETHALAQAREAYRQGISVAEARGDIQAAKEMKVFMKRVEKRLAEEG